MSETSRLQRQFGTGPLSRFSSFVYTLLAVEALLLLTTAPCLVAALFLTRDAANLPLYAACALPIGPAVSAALVALDSPRDLTELRPAAVFCRAYRANARAVLALWAPLLAGLTVIGTNLTHLDAAHIPFWWAALLVVIGVGALLWGVNAVVLVSFFQFRTRDVARLAAYFLTRTPGVTVATGCLLVVTAAIVVIGSEAALALLGSLLSLMLLTAYRPLISETTGTFTA